MCSSYELFAICAASMSSMPVHKLSNSASSECRECRSTSACEHLSVHEAADFDIHMVYMFLIFSTYSRLNLDVIRVNRGTNLLL
jgi:hypothetical protein